MNIPWAFLDQFLYDEFAYTPVWCYDSQRRHTHTHKSACKYPKLSNVHGIIYKSVGCLGGIFGMVATLEGLGVVFSGGLWHISFCTMAGS